MKIRTATDQATGKRLPASFCWWPMLVFAAVESGVVLPEARTK